MSLSNAILEANGLCRHPSNPRRQTVATGDGVGDDEKWLGTKSSRRQTMGGASYNKNSKGRFFCLFLFFQFLLFRLMASSEDFLNRRKFAQIEKTLRFLFEFIFFIHYILFSSSINTSAKSFERSLASKRTLYYNEADFKSYTTSFS